MSGRQLPRLITDNMAERAAIRHWLKDDTEHAALALLHGRYDRHAALQHVITNALAYAERAKVDAQLARSVAIAAFNASVVKHETKWAETREHMIQVARNILRLRPDDINNAVDAITDIARANQVPVSYMREAIRIAKGPRK